jgi:hypothetical protein
METAEKLGPHQKALTINLDAAVFGSFAEIGAGQEVARWFLTVGGASGTVAKTISAYDKEVSDDLYGTGTRYVSKGRLEAMLDNEWAQLLSQLHPTRGATTRFFSFVDTISARNFSGTNDCHGWVGLRFMQHPNGPPNDVILHVNLRDPSNLQQQEAVGILGVNLLYAVGHHLKSSGDFLASLMEDVGLERVELDLVDLKGPAFEGWDRNELHASLVIDGHAEAVVFPVDNHFLPSNEVFYKRAVVLEPGRFTHTELLRADLIRITLDELPAEELKESKGALGLFCLSVDPAVSDLKKLSPAETAKLAAELQKMGYGVILFHSSELYMMSAFLNRYTKFRIHFAVRLSVLVRIMEDRYRSLPGTLLEGIARMFTQNVRLVVHPMAVADLEQWVKETGTTGWTWEQTNGMVHADELHPAKPMDYLYQYLLSEFWIQPKKTAGVAGAA